MDPADTEDVVIKGKAAYFKMKYFFIAKTCMS